MLTWKKQFGSVVPLAVEFDERKIDGIFADINQCHLPGAAVGVAIGGVPVYRKGFGLASMELPVVLSPSMRMRIYSTTKHFTCLAFMLLCEERRASVDDPLGRYLPELHPVAHKVTMRQLMGNISGLRDVKTIWCQFSGMRHDVPIVDLLSLYSDIDDLDFAPGTTCSYNNGGFLLLTAVIERITGKRLEEVLRTRIFEPVRMHDTLLRRFDTDFVPNSATMHVTRAVGGFDRSYTPGERAGEGGIVSTVDDLLTWLAHMDAPVVGSAATWEAMKTPQKLANGTSTGYGFGLMIGQYRGVDIVHHGGGGMGANAQMLKVPAAGLDIAIMVNRHDVSGIALGNKILDVCLPGLTSIKESADAPVASGLFRSPTTGRVVQLGQASNAAFPWASDRRRIATVDGTEMLVEPDSSGVLWPVGAYAVTKQAITVIGDRQCPSAIRLSDFGNVDDLKRLEPISADHALTAIIGRYRSETTRTTAEIHTTGETKLLSTQGAFGSAQFTLECLADGVWRARSTNAVTPWGGILSFDAERTLFRFSSFGLRALMFRRIA